MLGNLGAAELFIIAILVLVFMGSKKLNELARGLGQSSKEFTKIKKEYNKALNEDYSDLEKKKKKKKKKKIAEGGDQP